MYQWKESTKQEFTAHQIELKPLNSLPTTQFLHLLLEFNRISQNFCMLVRESSSQDFHRIFHRISACLWEDPLDLVALFSVVRVILWLTVKKIPLISTEASVRLKSLQAKTFSYSMQKASMFLVLLYVRNHTSFCTFPEIPEPRGIGSYVLEKLRNSLQ